MARKNLALIPKNDLLAAVDQCSDLGAGLERIQALAVLLGSAEVEDFRFEDTLLSAAETVRQEGERMAKLLQEIEEKLNRELQAQKAARAEPSAEVVN